MSNRKLFELVLKIFGIYPILMFLKSLAPLLLVISTAMSNPDQSVYMPPLLLSILSPLIPLVLAAFFLLRSGAIASWIVKDEEPVVQPEESPPAYARLSFWIVIVGLYCFATSAGDLCNHAFKLFLKIQPGRFVQFSARDFIPSLVTFLLSLLFIFKSRAIEEWIEKTTCKPAFPEDPGEGE